MSRLLLTPFKKVRGGLVTSEAPWRSRIFVKRCQLRSRASRYEEGLARGALRHLKPLHSRLNLFSSHRCRYSASESFDTTDFSLLLQLVKLVFDLSLCLVVDGLLNTGAITVDNVAGNNDYVRVMPQEVSRRSDGTCLKHAQIPQKFRF